MPSAGNFPPAVAQSATDPQFANRVGADHQFKAVQVFGQRRGLPGHRARALLHLDAAERVLDDAEQVGSRSNCGIKCDHAVVGKAQRFAQTFD